MALSGREVMLIIRARDEASRTIGRVSAAMSRADRDALRIADRSTKQSRQNLVTLGNAAHDVQYNYQRMALEARKAYMEGKGSLAQRSKQLQQDMLAARTYRVEQMRNIELNRRAVKEQIDQANQIRQNIEEQRRLRRHQGQEMVATGGAAIAAGASMLYFGTQAARGFASAIQANIEYNQQVQKTATQVDTVAVNTLKLSRIGKQVGRDIPVAFEQIQPALYDIFSSIDVGYKGANKLIRQFARDAVGGQTDMETATRANLQIMNAYKISVKDAADVSDFMFQLVRKGVGTYDEFAKSIGRAIPSAARAGQNYRTLGAMMAFMTRNGVSAAMAATSSARALDAISNAKTVGKLEKMGIKVRDLQGNFKPLPHILDDIAKKMKGMTNVQKASFLQDLFKGAGGTIQARRFFDMYFKNADEFKKRNKEMQKSAGAAEEAFGRMSETPQAKIQNLKNQFELLRISVGEHLLPVAMKLVDWAGKLLAQWDKLSPRQQKMITLAAALVTALTLLMGAIMVVVGGIAIFIGSMNLMGVSAATGAANIAKVTGGLGLLASGLMMATQSSDKTTQAFGVMSSALGGAMAGSVFGPWGIAIGGLVGAGAGLIGMFKNTKDEARKNAEEMQKTRALEARKQSIDNIRTSLDQLTGAFTKNTRAAVLNDIQNDKTQKAQLENFNKLGISNRTYISSLLGNEKAAKRVNKVIQDAGKYYQYLAAVQSRAQVGPTNIQLPMPDLKPEELKRLHDEFKGLSTDAGSFGEALLSLNGAWAAQRAKITEAQAAQRKFAVDTAATSEVLGIAKKQLMAWPRKLVSTLNVNGVPQGMAQVKALGTQLKGLDRKQIKILLKAAGVEPTKKNIKDVQEAAKGLDKTKVTMPNVPKGVKQGTEQAKGAARSGATGIGKLLTEPLSKVKPDLKTFRTSTAHQVGAARGPAAAQAQALGFDVKNGVLVGISGLPSALSAQVTSAVNRAIAAGRAAADAHSPSREMIKLGLDMGEGLGIGIERKKPRVAKAASKLAKEVLAQLKTDDLLTTKQLSSIISDLPGKQKKGQVARAIKASSKQVDAFNKKSKELTAKRKQIEKAQDELQKLIDARQSFFETVQSGIQSFGSLGSISKPMDVFGNEGNYTAGYIASELTKKLATVREFGSNAAKVLKMYGKAIYSDLLTMGPEAGNEYAKALLSATPQEQSTIKTAYAGIQSAATSIATTGANNMYNAGIAVAQGMVNGLKSQEAKLVAEATALANKIAKAIKKALKIKSPSRVTHFMGKMTGKGMWLGMRSQYKDVVREAEAIAKAAAADPNRYSGGHNNGSRPPVGVGASGSAQASTNHIEQKITIHTQEIDPRAHAAKLGWELANRTGL